MQIFEVSLQTGEGMGSYLEFLIAQRAQLPHCCACVNP